MDLPHDLFQFIIQVIKVPPGKAPVLLHFQCRQGHASGIGRLARCMEHLVLFKAANSGFRAGHVGPFGHQHTGVSHQLFNIFVIQLVLRGAWQGDIALHIPGLVAVNPLAGAQVLQLVGGTALGLQQFL